MNKTSCLRLRARFLENELNWLCKSC